MNGVSGISSAQVLIGAMITPALLILASGSLIATSLVRLARVVDRIRKLLESGSHQAVELERQERRAMLAERSIVAYFCAIVLFVLAGFAIAMDHATGDRLTWLPVGMTVSGMVLIVMGSAAMLLECRLALVQIRSEIGAAGRKG